MEVHVVQKGDTLWKISRQYGISFEDLKRVNAHLANPDYVVPGMKIFLPDKVKKKEEVKKSGQGGGDHMKKTEKPPVKKPQPPKEEVEVPKKPKPLPVVPTPPKVPVKPPVESKPVPPKPKPTPKPKPEQPKPAPKPPITPPIQSKPVPPVPPMPSVPPQPMNPCPSFPMIGIPCGWLPIYDADCYPYVHPGQMQPMPSPMPQLPVQPESSHFPGHHVPIKPTKPKITDEWEVIEEEFIIEPPKQPEFKPVPLPELEPTPEPIPIPLPMPFPQYEMPMPPPVAPMQPMPWGCMQCGGQPSYSGHPLQCGCGSIQPMPMPMQHHQHHHGHCNACQQPIQRMPQMMPFPNQNNNWYGTH